MIETFIIDWPVLMIIGLVFGLFAPEEDWWRSRAFVGGFVAASAFTLVALISYGIAPDWMWMYFLESSEVSWIVPFIPLAYLFVYALSFAGAVSLVRTRKTFLWTALAMSVLMEAAVVAVTWDRYHLVGTTAQWTAGNAHELFSVSPSGPAKSIGLLSPLFVVALAGSLFVTWRGRREASARR